MEGRGEMDGLCCAGCGSTYPLNDRRWKCDCGHFLDIRFRPSFDREAIRTRKPTLWRYREALPIGDDRSIVSFDEGFTPLVPLALGRRELLLKLEQLFPTGSYKDRGASVLLSKVREAGIQEIVEDSSGNAGCAVAAYAARAGIPCEILVPESASPGKLAQIAMYGAKLRTVPGSREATADAALRAAATVYYASHSWNPFFLQGTKTFAYEVWEQLGFRAPGSLLIPTGNGTLLIGAYLGFRDLKKCGLIPAVPRLVAVQAANCAPLLRMFREGLGEVPPIDAGDTIAEGVAIARPIRGKQIVEIVRETGGEILAVTDEDVEKTLLILGKEGLYVEPTGALGVAAFLRHGHLGDGTTVAPLTGHGLKANDKLQKIATKR
jgi:threonine synthase